MEALGPAQLFLCALVVIAAFAVRGTTGFGGNAIAVPLLTLALPIHSVVAVMRVTGYFKIGFYDTPTLLMVAAAFPLMLIGARLGGLTAGRINQTLFNRIVGTVLMCSGVLLLFK